MEITEEIATVVGDLESLGVPLHPRVRPLIGVYVSNLPDGQYRTVITGNLDHLQQLLKYQDCSLDDLPWPIVTPTPEAHDASAEVSATAAPTTPHSPDQAGDSDSLQRTVLETHVASLKSVLDGSVDDLKAARDSDERSLALRVCIDETLKKSYDALGVAGQMLASEGALSAIRVKSLVNDILKLVDDIHDIVMNLQESEQLVMGKMTFPFPNAREGQMEAAEETARALLKSDVIACAPTGFGKSAFVLATCSYFMQLDPTTGEPQFYAPLDRWGAPPAAAYVITPQRVLVQQYEQDFGDLPWVGFLKSRAQFQCICKAAEKKNKEAKAFRDEDKVTCSDMSKSCDHQDSKFANPDKPLCPYMVNKQKALQKPVVVMTAAMAATLLLYQKQTFPKRCIIAIDESQRLEDTLISSCTARLQMDKLNQEGWDFANGVLTVEGEAYETAVLPKLKSSADEMDVRRWVEGWCERASTIILSLEDRASDDSLGKGGLAILSKYSNLLTKLVMIMRLDDLDLPEHRRRPHSWRYITDTRDFDVRQNGPYLAISPLSARGLTDDIVGDAAIRKLFVSATPGDANLSAETLGLRVVPQYQEYGSAFPVENRKLMYMPVAKLNYHSDEEDYQQVMDAICFIAGMESDDPRLNHRFQKGIIHTVSRTLQDRIKTALQQAGHGHRIVEVVGSRGRTQILERFMLSSQPQILLGPALTDGVSLSDDAGRWGIIPKLAWPPPVDPSVKYRKEEIPDWYVFQVVMSVIQACGRIVRSKDDWGTNYILDAGFGNLVRRNGHLFPGWFKAAIEEM